MNRLLIGYIVFSVGALGFLSFANAEEYTVVVPFDSHGVTCEFQELSVEYQCVWQGFKEVYTLEDLKEYKELLTAERYDQEIQKLNEIAFWLEFGGFGSKAESKLSYSRMCSS